MIFSGGGFVMLKCIICLESIIDWIEMRQWLAVIAALRGIIADLSQIVHMIYVFFGFHSVIS